MTFADLISRLRGLAPFADDGAAERALSAVLPQLGRRLLPEELCAVSAQLPGEAAHLLREASSAATTEEDLLDSIVAAEHVRPKLAIEHLQLVLQAISPALDTTAKTHLARAVPELAWLLEPKAAGESRPDVTHHGGRHTLSEGRPGSEHPLSTAHPESGHRHSIARSLDPHGDTKISGAR